MACFLTIWVLLGQWSWKPVPILPSGFTLNAIISVLATASKSAMLFVVSSCLSQGKWTWFRERRPITHLQLFEDASRGLLGAINLIMSRAVISTTSIGATITLLALAFDPSVQQVLTYPSVPVEQPSNSSTVKKAPGFWGLPYTYDTLDALNRGIWMDDFEQVPQCAATNCTWDSIQSIGWCHKCENVATIMQNNCSADFFDYLPLNRTCEFVIEGQPGIHSFKITGSTVSSEIHGSWPLFIDMPDIWTWDLKREPSQPNNSWIGDSVYIGVRNPLVAFGFVNGTRVDDETGLITPAATQVCTLDLCLHTYNITVRNNAPNDTLRETSYGTKFAHNTTDGSGNTLYC